MLHSIIICFIIIIIFIIIPHVCSYPARYGTFPSEACLLLDAETEEVRGTDVATTTNVPVTERPVPVATAGMRSDGRRGRLRPPDGGHLVGYEVVQLLEEVPRRGALQGDPLQGFLARINTHDDNNDTS